MGKFIFFIFFKCAATLIVFCVYVDNTVQYIGLFMIVYENASLNFNHVAICCTTYYNMVVIFK